MVSANLNIHFSPSTRQDKWVRLRSAATKYEEIRRNGENGEKCLEELHEILEFLEPLESLWAFPGRARFDELVGLLAEGLERSFMFAVSDITDLIESRKTGDDVHYFEVLVVGHISGRKEDFLRHNLIQWRSNQDKFVYDVIVVPSMSEALVAVLLNYDIQSVIVHDDFVVESEQSLLKLAGLPKLMNNETSLSSSDNHSLMLGKMIHDIRPELDLFLSTRVSPTDLAGSAKSFSRLFHLYENTGAANFKRKFGIPITLAEGFSQFLRQ